MADIAMATRGPKSHVRTEDSCSAEHSTPREAYRVAATRQANTAEVAGDIEKFLGFKSLAEKQFSRQLQLHLSCAHSNLQTERQSSACRSTAVCSRLFTPHPELRTQLCSCECTAPCGRQRAESRAEASSHSRSALRVATTQGYTELQQPVQLGVPAGGKVTRWW